MNAFSPDFYLLLIVLIITCVSLFLCLYNALLLFDVAKRITALTNNKEIPSREGHTGTGGRNQVARPATFSEEIGIRDSFREHEDIVTGIDKIAEKYHIDALVVAVPEGLVVASAGASDPEYDAAYYSNLFTGEYAMPEEGVWLLPLDHRGIPLIGIARNHEVISKEMTTRMAEEIKLIFERGL